MSCQNSNSLFFNKNVRVQNKSWVILPEYLRTYPWVFFGVQLLCTTSIKALKMVDPSFWYWQVWHKVSLRGNFLNPMMIWPAVVVRTLSNQQPQFTMSSKRKLVLYFEKNL